MYRQLKDIDGSLLNQVQRLSDMAFIPFNPHNIDYQEYLKWVEEGNTPLPAEGTE